MTKIGAITVGQSPRVDVIPEMEPILGDSFEILQMGGLDGLSKEEIAAFKPRENDHILVSRLTDGSSVTFGESHILPRLQDCIHKLEENGASLILFLCTGEFPENFAFQSPPDLPQPDPIRRCPGFDPRRPSDRPHSLRRSNGTDGTKMETARFLRHRPSRLAL